MRERIGPIETRKYSVVCLKPHFQGTPPANAPFLASAFMASVTGRATRRKPSHITHEVATDKSFTMNRGPWKQ